MHPQATRSGGTREVGKFLTQDDTVAQCNRRRIQTAIAASLTSPGKIRVTKFHDLSGQAGDFGFHQASSEDLHFIDCHGGISITGPEVETEAVAGFGALGEFAGGDEFAIHVQALATLADGGDDMVPLTVIEGPGRIEGFVSLERESNLAVLD